jgi:BirA family biotin operon repressor/biotin-[acetyl-CoA-carboxylase] ligase
MEYLRIYPSLDSTNKEAHRLLALGNVPSGLTLFTTHQTEGRGQMGRTWAAAPGLHMAMTIIYRPEAMPVTQLPTLGMKISLGLVRALEKLNSAIGPQIKWPNDIYADGKKLSGILIENALAGGIVQHAVIGIGMNILEGHFPEDLPNATSLLLCTGEKYDPQQVAIRIRNQVLTLLDDPDPFWKSEYDRYIFGLEKVFTFSHETSSFPARVKGISAEGLLILEDEKKNMHAYATHEVRWNMIQ